MSQITPQSEEQEQSAEFQFVRYGVAIFVAICTATAICMASSDPESGLHNLSIFMTSIIALLSFILGYIGFIVGDFLRCWVMPSHFIANDFISLIKMKIFWKIGPQAVGTFMGIIIPMILFAE